MVWVMNIIKKQMLLTKMVTSLHLVVQLLGQATSNREVKTQLPTGVPVSGSIKFLNVLPTVTKFSLINIPWAVQIGMVVVVEKEGVIEIKDVIINWK